ncbi:Riboflavin transporter RibZ [Baekduia alba]|uniref:MFS transporter n=1 Tax=Baekduia alba TaxID=2997333 RepID=UPI00233FE4A2|nr:MFS transporter [Baekduia alba]WCB93090.1 Riboflavin transporter RibZ [Baekduia alba]
MTAVDRSADLGSGGDARAGWLPIAVLAAAQFVMVLDSSVMNVSISQIVADLDTTIQGVQLAITAYTLVMASLMLLGARLGDIIGRDRCFAIGLAVYGVGSLTTALSPNLTVLLIGWSLVEGIGAALVVPAIVSIIAATYDGHQRAVAFGIVGGIAGAAIAAGPLIGGWVTTELSWRYVFVGEVVVVVAILVVRRRLHKSPPVAHPPKLDVVGVLLSAIGLALTVFGILKSSEWGWIEPLGAMTIGGQEITPLGFSVVPFLILAGGGLLAAFAVWEERRERLGLDTLLDRALLKIPALRAGLSTLMMQQLILLGTFFVLPVYLQVVLGLDAFETGKRLFPMSVTMFVAALLGPRLAAGFAPKRVAQVGLVALVVAAVLLLETIDVELNDTGFAVSLALFGVGAGLLLSQLGNVIMSSVDPSQTNEAGGLQGTAQNLGASLGTAFIGSVLIASLSSGFVAKVQANPALRPAVQEQVAAVAQKGIPVAPVAEVEQAARDAGVPPRQAAELADDYGDAQLDGLRRAMGAIALFAAVSLWFTRRLPGHTRDAA